MQSSIEFHDFFLALQNDEVKIVYHHPIVAEVLATLNKRNHCPLDRIDALDDSLILYLHDDFLSHGSLQHILSQLKKSHATGMIAPYSKRSEALQADKILQLLRQILALTRADIDHALRLRRAALELFLSHAGGELTLLNKQLSVCFKPAGRLRILNPRCSILHGTLYNIGHLLELACVNSPRQPPDMVLNGVFPFAGMVYEGNRRFISAQLDHTIQRLNAEFASNTGKNQLFIQANKVIDVQSNGQSVLNLLMPHLPGAHREVTEFSFGCNALLYQTVDFCDGSILNETVEGLHIGVGWPEYVHLDFVLPMRLSGVLLSSANMATF
jgi:hypothetical protein